VPAPLVDHRPLAVAQVANRGHARFEVTRQAVLDDRVQLLGGEAGQPVQRAVLAVRAEMDVGVDQSR